MSRFCFSRPNDIVWTVVGTGASIVSAISNLTDNRPDSTARFQWLSGAQTTASVFKLRGEWTSGVFSPLCVGLSNISLPVGTKISVAFRRVGDAVGTYPYVPTIYNNNQRVVGGVRGERMAWILMPTPTVVTGVEISIWNDVNGTASIAAGTFFNIGEAVVAPGRDLDVLAGWRCPTIDPTQEGFSWNRQPYDEPGVPYRQWTFGLPVDSQLAFFGDPANPQIIDYEELFALLDRGQSGVFFPRMFDATGAFDAQAVHRFGFVGRMTTMPSYDHESASWFSTKGGNAVITEAPIAT